MGVLLPVALFLLELVEDVLRGSENGQVNVVDSGIAFRKYFKSSRLLKPASCDTLFNRTSTTRLTPDFLSRVKKSSAFLWVKPMVQILIERV